MATRPSSGIWYDKDEDILGIRVSSGKYWKSIEHPGGVVVDIDHQGRILGMEISRAKEFFHGDARKVLETATAAKARA